MRARPWTSLFCLGAGLAAASGFTGPTRAKYRIDLRNEQVVDLSAMGQGEQRVSFSLAAFVDATVADSAGGQTLGVVIDSLHPDSAAQIPPNMLEGAKGATWRGFVGSDGKLTVLQKFAESPLTAGMEGLLRRFLPPRKSGMKQGDGWTDTTDTADESANGSLRMRTVTNYQVSTDTYEGVKAFKVAGASSNSMTGSQQTPGGEGSLEGTGTGAIAYFGATEGRYLGSTGKNTQKMLASGAVGPTPLPITVTSETTVTLLK